VWVRWSDRSWIRTHTLPRCGTDCIQVGLKKSWQENKKLLVCYTDVLVISNLRNLRNLSMNAIVNMNASGLDLLFLEVNNLEESLGFYQGLLGLVLESFNLKSDPPMATLRAGALKITLAQQLETMLRRGRGAHFFIGVDDVDSLYEDIKEKVPEVHPPVDDGWGGRFITLQDPDKYRFFFVTWSEGTKSVPPRGSEWVGNISD